jgi:hypothetical protein
LKIQNFILTLRVLRRCFEWATAQTKTYEEETQITNESAKEKVRKIVHVGLKKCLKNFHF